MSDGICQMVMMYNLSLFLKNMWSHLSHAVTLVTCGHTCNMWSHLSCEANVSTADQKVHSLSYEEHDQHVDLRGRR